MLNNLPSREELLLIRSCLVGIINLTLLLQQADSKEEAEVYIQGIEDIRQNRMPNDLKTFTPVKDDIRVKLGDFAAVYDNCKRLNVI